MKKTLIVLFALCLIPSVLAINIDVEKFSNDESMIYGLEKPTEFNIQVTNNGNSDFFTLYTFFGTGITPKEPIRIDKGESKNITFYIAPRENSELKNVVSFDYFIRGQDRSKVTEKLIVEIFDLDEAIKVGSNSINLDSEEITVFIENKVNFEFENLSVKMNSPFFEMEKIINLEPYEKKEFTLDLNKEEFQELVAGFYTLSADVEIENVKANVEGKIEFVEKDLLKTETKNYGFLINTKIIRKTNEGNTIEDSQVIVKKDIISRLFTTFNPEPDFVERKGGSVYYTWTNKIGPGSSIEIDVKTNWLIPILLIIFIVATIYFTKVYLTQKLVLRKKVSFVKAKGGEFALKVTIIAEAREFVEKVRIVDRLPPLVKMYERFGGELPDKISKDKKRLEWEFSHLEAGEKRIMTYIIFSKIGVLGRFALPGTVALYEKDGKLKESSSNKAYFLAEQKSKKHSN